MQKLTALFRKLEIEGKTYYRCDYVGPEIVPNGRYDELNNRLSSDKNIFYVTDTQTQFDKLGFKETNIFCEQMSGLVMVEDPDEISLVSSEFKKSLEPREVVSSYRNTGNPDNRDTLVNECILNMYKETKCRRPQIKEIVQTIMFNSDLSDANIPAHDMGLIHDNIILYGPLGSGKSMVLESLKNNIDQPVIEIELTEDVELNRGLIEDALVNNEKEFDGNAVVIVSINYPLFNQLFHGDSFFPLKELTAFTNPIYSERLKKPIDLNNLTFIATADIDENTIGVEHDKLGAYFKVISGCTKAIEFNRFTMTETKRILTESAFSKIEFCRGEALKYGRTFEVDDKYLALIIKYNDTFGGNLLYIDSAIMDSFKYQLQRGYKHITIGRETFAFLKAILEREKAKGMISQAPTNDIEEDEAEEETSVEAKSLAEKEEKIRQISEEIKKTIKGQDKQVHEIITAIMKNQDYAHNPNIKNPEKRKANILIRGASGTGKTEIIRQAAQILGIPIVVEDATRFTEEGYVGNSATDMLLDIVRVTNENIAEAECGIIVIDEVDKKANNGERSDVARGAVLNSLLKMIEGEKYQLELKKATPQGNIVKTIHFDTRKLTFICLGAFEGLDDYRENRIKKATKPKSLGFQDSAQQAQIEEELKGLNTGFINEDYVTFGFTEQFINRLDKKIYLNKLTRDDLLCIAKTGALSPVRLLIEDYADYGLEIEFTDDFYERLADISFTKKSGARSIKEVFEDLKSFVDFDNIELSKYSKVIFNAACFDDPNALTLIEKQNNKVFVKE